MAENYTYNATHLTTVREAEFTQNAELGQVGSFRVAIDDTDGTLAIIGQKDFSHTESSCSFTRTFRGFVGDREYGRDAGQDRAPHVGAARGIGISGEDLNAMLGFRLINDQLPDVTAEQGGRRPSETIAQRGAWLMASSFVSGLFVDNGRCSFSSTILMDKADYRQQFPGDVLADMALAAEGYNYYVADWGAGPELVFRDDNASTADTSTLRLSNVLADASSVTFHPFKDATLRRSPSRVKSKLAYTFAKGTRVVERAATATTFNGERGGTASNSNVKNGDVAIEQATAELHQFSTEEDIIECTVQVTSAEVNLILAGHRIQVKFSHLATEGYGSFTWFRVLERTVKPIVADAGLYELRLKLSPQEAAAPAPTCSASDTPSATYYPLGGSGRVANLVGTNIAYYHRGGLAEPFAPNPLYQGDWYYSTYGVGGLGTIDYFASGYGNTIRFIVVGNGTLTIQTERYAGQPQPYTVDVIHQVSGISVPVGGTVTGTAGASTAITVTTATNPDCIHIIILGAPYRVDGLHIGMGRSSADLVASP